MLSCCVPPILTFLFCHVGCHQVLVGQHTLSKTRCTNNTQIHTNTHFYQISQKVKSRDALAEALHIQPGGGLAKETANDHSCMRGLTVNTGTKNQPIVCDAQSNKDASLRLEAVKPASLSCVADTTQWTCVNTQGNYERSKPRSHHVSLVSN